MLLIPLGYASLSRYPNVLTGYDEDCKVNSPSHFSTIQTSNERKFAWLARKIITALLLPLLCHIQCAAQCRPVTALFRWRHASINYHVTMHKTRLSNYSSTVQWRKLLLSLLTDVYNSSQVCLGLGGLNIKKEPRSMCNLRQILFNCNNFCFPLQKENLKHVACLFFSRFPHTTSTQTLPSKYLNSVLSVNIFLSKKI